MKAPNRTGHPFHQQVVTSKTYQSKHPRSSLRACTSVPRLLELSTEPCEGTVRKSTADPKPEACNPELVYRRWLGILNCQPIGWLTLAPHLARAVCKSLSPSPSSSGLTVGCTPVLFFFVWTLGTRHTERSPRRCLRLLGTG